MKSDELNEGWQNALLNVGVTITQAIRGLDDTGLQIALVVDSAGTFIGTLTDGDIRRGLLSGLDLNSPIEPIVCREPLVVPAHIERETALEIMRVNKVRQVPIIDEDQHVVGLHLWDEILVPTELPNLMVLMVGGRGARLGSRTEQCPKPMLPVNGKPMLEHIIEGAKDSGFKHFALAINYLGHIIEDHFGDGSGWDVEIDYLREDTALGTAGALSLINPRPEIPFVVSNGDVLTDIRYSELLAFHEHHHATATMAVRMYELQHPFGVVHSEGIDIVRFEEKPIARSYINAGVYVLDPRALDALSVGEHCNMPSLFQLLQSKSERTIVYPVHEQWLDVGRVDDLERAQAEYRPTSKSEKPKNLAP